jgi:hypothetical protein
VEVKDGRPALKDKSLTAISLENFGSSASHKFFIGPQHYVPQDSTLRHVDSICGPECTNSTVAVCCDERNARSHEIISMCVWAVSLAVFHTYHPLSAR